MKVSEVFSGNYLNAADVQPPRVYTMTSVAPEKMPDGAEKMVLRFQGETRGLVLNKVNAHAIAEIHGDETSSWPGRQIELFATTTMFGGKNVPCIRVRSVSEPRPAQQGVPHQPVAPQQPGHQQQAIQQPQYSAAAPQQPPTTAPMSDVPFDA